MMFTSLRRSSSVVNRFHPAFLRENTWEAWDASSRQRLDFNLPVGGLSVLSETTIKTPGKNDTVRLEFSDGHIGHFCPPRVADEMWGKDLPRWPKKLWGGSSETLTPAGIQRELGKGGSLRFHWDAMIGRDKATLHAYAEALHMYGVAIVEGMPAKEDTVIEFANHTVGYVYPSVYGYKFTVKSVEKPNNLAYSSLGLQQHTDLPFYSIPPSIQLFHCIVKGRKGGSSLFFDGFAAARELHAEDPAAFATLCEQQVRFQDVCDAWHLSARQATFSLKEGMNVSDGPAALARICFNERARDSWRGWTGKECLQEQEKFYNALRKYEKIVEDRDRYAQVLLEPGEMACTDNFRVMHSRDSFEGARHLEGAYIDWDAIYAVWRATSEKSDEIGLSMPPLPHTGPSDGA